DSGPQVFKKTLGLSWLKCGSLPAKADVQKQRTFLDQELTPRLDEAERGKRKVFFGDAVHFVYGAFLGHLWCLARLFVPTGSGRQRFSVLGAIAAFTNELVATTTTGTVTRDTVC